MIPAEKTILKIDASLLKDSSCLLRTFYTLIGQYQHPLVSNVLQFGSSFHKFASEIHLTNGDIAKAFKAAKEVHARPCQIEYKKDYLQDVTYLGKVCFQWWDWEQANGQFDLLKIDDKPLVEMTFCFKIYEDDYLIIMLSGTLDKIGKIKNGCYAIGDYKTSATTDIVGYFGQYRLSTQLMTYLYAIKKHGELYPNSIWEEVSRARVGVFIDGVFLRGRDKEPEFKRSPVILHKPDIMLEYEHLLNLQVDRIARMFHSHRTITVLPIKEGLINGSCAGAYRLCKYFHACASEDDAIRQSVLDRQFIKKPYDPLMFGKE